MEQRIIATSEPGFMQYKKPALWIMQGNTMTKLATFISDKARKDFLEVLEEEFQGHIVQDFRDLNEVQANVRTGK